MALYFIKDTTLSEIANAIRAKTGAAGAIPVANMATEISSIVTGNVSMGELPFVAFGVEEGLYSPMSINWALTNKGELILYCTADYGTWMKSYSDDVRPSWEQYKDQINSLSVTMYGTNSHATIGTSCFKNYPNLKHVRFCEGLVRLGENCFEGCPIETLVIPISLTEINKGAFKNCTALSSVTMTNPNKWMVDNNVNNFMTLSNPTTNATYLKQTYVNSSLARFTA